MSKQVRVGIDVGGTFTDVVVIDHQNREVIAQLKVPTTHHAPEGVANGIMNALHRTLAELKIQPQEVIFIAHATTQATNALLEGDVAKVGIIGIGSGLEGLKAKFDTRVPKIELAPNRFLNPEHVFVSNQNTSLQTIENQFIEFKKKGVEVIVTSEAFGVDHPENEKLITEHAQKLGFFATSGHEVSTLYGLRTRTRTAVINGAILPKMIHTANMTNQCVQQTGITAPLMIMRSDGGVMHVEEVHRRPILTLLSGPAAGIAGALMYEKVSDGIFIEVGGTSADISVIRDGQPQTKTASIAGHRTYLNTLDVRTLAIAGGSMIREKNGYLIDVGSRSAHIAGLPYACFAPVEALIGAKLVHLRPTESDTDDYIALENAEGKRFALTPTCVANALSLIPSDVFGYAEPSAARLGLQPLAERLGTTIEIAGQQVLEIACRKLTVQIEALIKEYQLDRNVVELVGGGGGAASLIFFTAQQLKLPVRLAKRASVISTIGVALAMVRESIERHIITPTPADLLRVRQEAFESVVKIGAVPASVEVQVEVDRQRNKVRATAFGTTQLQNKVDNTTNITFEGCKQLAARSMNVSVEQVHCKYSNEHYYIFEHQKISDFKMPIFNLFGKPKPKLEIRVIEKTGVIRLQRSHAQVLDTTVGEIAGVLENLVSDLTHFGDSGRELPNLHLIVGSRFIQLTGLADAAQAAALSRAELEHRMPSEKIMIIATQVE